jgi:hypothetical protein
MKLICLTFIIYIASLTTKLSAQNAQLINEDSTSLKTVVTPLQNATIKPIVVKLNSDIRIFLNRERNVENFKIIFPRTNKRKLS